MQKRTKGLNRNRKFMLNSIAGLMRQLITMVCGFVITKAMLITYGSEINGLVASITQFLGFITFLEMGIGPVIQSNLYKPLAKGDMHSVSQIVRASEKFFRSIACIFIVYIIVLCIVYPNIINSNRSALFLVLLIIILSISLLSQYFFGMTYQLLLNADQKGYIQYLLNSITLIVNTVLCLILMKCGMSIHIVRLVTATIYIFRPIILCIYVKNNYNLEKNITYEENPIKQKWNGFTQHLASVVLDNTDVVVLTAMSTLSNISIYTVFYNVVYGVTQIIMTTVNGLEAMWGNMIANEEWNTLKKSFAYIEWFSHQAITILFTATGVLITPFILIYTSGVNDADYYQPIFGALLVLAFGMQCYRTPYAKMIKAAGHYKQTQNGAFISLVINIMLSVVFVKKWGLIGVALGTIAALSYHTVYFVVYLKNNIVKRKVSIFVKYLITDFLIMILAVLLVKVSISNIYMNGYINWVIIAIKVTIEVIVVSVVINYCFYKKYFGLLISKILEIFRANFHTKG